MTWLRRQVLAVEFDNQGETGFPKRLVKLSELLDIDELSPFGPVVVETGQTNVRIDPYSSSVAQVETSQYIGLQVTGTWTAGQVSIKVGTTSSEAIPLTAKTSGTAVVLLDAQLTRSATTGLFITNSGSADVTVEGFIAGT